MEIVYNCIKAKPVMSFWPRSFSKALGAVFVGFVLNLFAFWLEHLPEDREDEEEVEGRIGN